jgi:hypothetical protein
MRNHSKWRVVKLSTITRNTVTNSLTAVLTRRWTTAVVNSMEAPLESVRALLRPEAVRVPVATVTVMDASAIHS